MARWPCPSPTRTLDGGDARRSSHRLSVLCTQSRPPPVGADAERPGTTAEVLLSYLIQEFGDNRSITSVVPLDNPAAADEPDLLALSPEQAEETQLCALPVRRPHIIHAPILRQHTGDFGCACTSGARRRGLSNQPRPCVNVRSCKPGMLPSLEVSWIAGFVLLSPSNLVSAAAEGT